MEFARRRGIAELVPALEGQLAWLLVEVGEVDRGLAMFGAALEHTPDDDAFTRGSLVADRARVLAERGDAQGAAADPERIGAARPIDAPDAIAASLIATSAFRLALGDTVTARAELEAMAMSPELRATGIFHGALVDLVRSAVRCGDPALAAELVTGFVPATLGAEMSARLAGAHISVARGDLEASAAELAELVPTWPSFGSMWRLAETQLLLGRCLLRLGRAAEARSALEAAHDVYGRLGAPPRVAEAEALLAEAR